MSGLTGTADAATPRGLRFSNDDEPGISGRRTGRGFRYLGPGGRPNRDPEVLDRISSAADVRSVTWGLVPDLV